MKIVASCRRAESAFEQLPIADPPFPSLAIVPAAPRALEQVSSAPCNSGSGCTNPEQQQPLSGSSFEMLS